jgi:hypothetical protein
MSISGESVRRIAGFDARGEQENMTRLASAIVNLRQYDVDFFALGMV